MNLPNLITLSRLVMTGACFACLVLAEPGDALGDAPRDAVLVWAAFWLFVMAAATDFVDGYLARRLGQVTRFGRVVDPFADKILVCGTLILLLDYPGSRSVMPPWFVVVVVAREFLVTTIRGLAESSGVAFPAERLGKYKMVAQCVLGGALLTLAAGTQRFESVAVVALWVTLLLTVWSGVGYTWRARRLLGSG